MTVQKDQMAVLAGDPPVSVLLRFSRQARRMSLRVSRLDGRVTLTVPHSVKAREALAFAEERADWLRGHLARTPSAQEVGFGTVLPIEGALTTVVAAGVKRPVLDQDQLLIPERSKAPGSVVEAFVKNLARDRLSVASQRFAEDLGRKVTKLTLRDTRSRWGSCTSAGGLMFSWRLGLAPPAVLQYVAAHEAAHLVEMNHSSAFWAVNARLFPDFQAQRQWLKVHGTGLHKWRFKAD